jgi:histidinol dehydrogenase
MLPIYNANDMRDIKQRLVNRADSMDENIIASVRKIIAEIREIGNEALFEYTKKFDGFDLDARNMAVTRQEVQAAYVHADPALVEIMKKSATNIRNYHERQKRETWKVEKSGITLGQIIRPLKRVGVYVPGGKASYPSSVLMNIIPAKVAGVSEIVMVTPPGKTGSIDPLTLVAADIAGADTILRIGGAQAVAALAYGTQTIKRVDKITGPGNIYVAAAKREVFGQVGIDMVAGPSEVLVIADDSADPRFIAADFLSQAEHDEMAACILIALDYNTALQARKEILRQLDQLPRKKIAQKSLENHGAILIAQDIKEAIATANEIAPEHLELCIRDAESCVELIENAGAIFIGHYSPEPLGDYYAGPNHVLPTNGTARFFSPLSVDDFIKKSSLIGYTKQSLEAVYKDIGAFAKAEGLAAHERSVRIRFEEI